MFVNAIPKPGDVYWIDEDSHRFVIITPEQINELGVSMAVPIASIKALKNMGLTVPITGCKLSGVAICNQVRSFDIKSRVEARRACYMETLDQKLTLEIVVRVLSVIEPAIL